MFVTRPEFAFQLPDQLKEPGAQYWRFLMPALNTTTYFLRLAIEDSEGSHVVTMIASSDHDVIDAIEELQPKRVLSLDCVRPFVFEEPASAVRVFSVQEIWQAQPRKTDGGRLWLLVDAEGVERTGLFAEVVNGKPKRQRLVARIGELRTTPPLPTGSARQ